MLPVISLFYCLSIYDGHIQLRYCTQHNKGKNWMLVRLYTHRRHHIAINMSCLISSWEESDCCISRGHYTVQCCYNAVNFLPNPLKRHPIAVRYGVSFVSSKYYLCFAAAIALLYVVSWYIRQHYNSTWLYNAFYQPSQPWHDIWLFPYVTMSYHV